MPRASLIVAAFFLFLISAQAATLKVGGGEDFSLISDAINAAKPGDIIEVKNGTYFENVNVTKSVTLIGIGHPVVDARNIGNAIVLSADGITLEGIHAVNAGQAGIKVISNRNILKNNRASDSQMGLDMVNSSHNILKDNLLFNNLVNFEILFLRYDIPYDNDIDTSNLVDGKPIYYLMGASDMVLGHQSNAGAVYCLNCRNITVKDLSFKNTAMGIILVFTNNSTLENNQFDQNKGGLFLESSNNNIIKNNTLTDNDRTGIFLHASSSNSIQGNNISANDYGIFLLTSFNNLVQDNEIADNNEGIKLFMGSAGNRIIFNKALKNKIGISAKTSSANKIWLNNFIDNSRQAEPGSGNIWNSTSPMNYRYNDAIFNSSLGNFWSDYSEQDVEEDGLGDKPYALGQDIDWYPLLAESSSYHVSL